MTPNFEIVDPVESLCYAPARSEWSPLSTERIGVSLSHLVPEIRWPKFGLIIHKMYYLIVLKHFVSIFLLIFDPIDPLFHWS